MTNNVFYKLLKERIQRSKIWRMNGPENRNGIPVQKCKNNRSVVAHHITRKLLPQGHDVKQGFSS
jgi:hypothetical protein